MINAIGDGVPSKGLIASAKMALATKSVAVRSTRHVTSRARTRR